jgi:hypothetical protein
VIGHAGKQNKGSHPDKPVEPNNLYKRINFKVITNKMKSAKTAAIDVQIFPAVSSEPLSIPLTRNASLVYSTGYARSCLWDGLLGK